MKKTKWDQVKSNEEMELKEEQIESIHVFNKITQGINGYEVDININDCEARFLLTKGSTHEGIFFK
jgi:hypothetical protein